MWGTDKPAWLHISKQCHWFTLERNMRTWNSKDTFYLMCLPLTDLPWLVQISRNVQYSCKIGYFNIHFHNHIKPSSPLTCIPLCSITSSLKLYIFLSVKACHTGGTSFNSHIDRMPQQLVWLDWREYFLYQSQVMSEYYI